MQKVVDTGETDLQANTDTGTPAQTDIYGEPALEVAESPERMPLRFGRSYSANTDSSPKLASLLKISREIYKDGARPEDYQAAAYKRACLAAESHGLDLRSVLSETSRPPWHVPPVKKCVNKVTWDEIVSVREFSGTTDNDVDLTQPLLDSTPVATPDSVCYIMTCIIGLDSSKRELLYLAHNSHPSPLNETFPIV